MKKDTLQTEYTITINHHPINFYVILAIVLISWGVFCVILIAGIEVKERLTETEIETGQIIMLIIMFLGMMLIGKLYTYFDKRNTVVIYNKNELKIQSYSKETIIKLQEITCISYDFFEENQGIHRCDMRVELTITIGNREIYINDRIERKQIKSCISGKNRKVPLMQLYSFIAEIYPDKAMGYKE